MTSQEKALQAFAQFAAKLKGDEKSEAQTFLFHLLEAFGHNPNTLPEGCTFEYLRFSNLRPIASAKEGRTVFADHLPPWTMHRHRLQVSNKWFYLRLSLWYKSRGKCACPTKPKTLQSVT